jgi:hypothetical protein
MSLLEMNKTKKKQLNYQLNRSLFFVLFQIF